MSKKQKLTPWFDGDVRPAHPGVYERKGAVWRYACWTGFAWGFGAMEPEEAERIGYEGHSDYQHCRWRGLAEAPK